MAPTGISSNDLPIGKPSLDSEPVLDVYAKPFIPERLKTINQLPARIIECAPAPWISFAAYVQSFAGTKYLPRQPKVAPKPADKQVIPVSSGLCTENYEAFFLHLHGQEDAAQELENDEQALYQVRLYTEGHPRSLLHYLNVPGLREGSRRVEIGDIVGVRQIRHDPRNGEIMLPPRLTNLSGKQLSRLTFDQHNAVVWGVNRAKELLVLRIDRLHDESAIVNVMWTLQARRRQAQYDAIVSTQASLGSYQHTWMSTMLFPDRGNGVLQTTLGVGRSSFAAYDEQLNYEQLKAVDTVLNGNYGAIPFLISGPPGTGKTKTLVELALQLIRKDADSHLLICAPSDAAADTLAQRLSTYLKPPQLFRLNSPSRGNNEVPAYLLPFCIYESDVNGTFFSLPDVSNLKRKNIVVTTCRDAALIVSACFTNRDLVHLEQNLATDFQWTGHPLSALHWTALLMDEAAQATEIETLIPISVVAPPEDLPIGLTSPSLVMAGDEYQLGPRTACKLPALQQSLVARLFQRDIYRSHPLARSQGTMARLTQAMLPIIRPPFANLIRNYRSHPAILATPSSLFYNDTLEPEAAQTESLTSWPGWRGKGWPVLFACNSSQDEIDGEGGGWYNMQEAHKAVAYAHSFLRANLLHAKEICIMSPFAAQVQRLRQIARHAGLWGVNIGPLEAFQGLESRLVILCTTRTRDRFIEQDVVKGLGVIHEPKRFNVAITRAKEGLIVLGHPDVLARDQSWVAFMSFCARNGLWQAEDNVDAPKWTNVELEPRSRLERRLLRHDELATAPVTENVRKLGIRAEEDDAMWTDGVSTQTALEVGFVEDEDLADDAEGHQDS